MKIVQINAVCGKGSTGKICADISKGLNDKSIENYILYSSGQSDLPNSIKITGDKSLKVQALKAHIVGNWGFNSAQATKRILAGLDKIKPDIVHLHNIHGHDCDLKALFNYFKENHIKIIWTFHDCWAFTGYCTHFMMENCNKWIDGCDNCPKWKRYSYFFDKSKKNYELKKKLFCDVDLTVVTPSKWLADLVKKSFLKEHKIEVINNGIDLSLFSPNENDFRKKYDIENKHLLLGVAFGWGTSKGLDVFINLAKRLDDSYQIVLVGTNDEVKSKLPNNIIAINRTYSQSELAEIYSSADLLVNPTREDNFPTVNIEALACGTPVLTFKTGGSPEIIDDTCGCVVESDDFDSLVDKIRWICTERPFSQNVCVERAKKFDRSNMVNEYLKLYENQSI